MNLEWKTSVMQKATIITKENKIEIFDSTARSVEKSYFWWPKIRNVTKIDLQKCDTMLALKKQQKKMLKWKVRNLSHKSNFTNARLETKDYSRSIQDWMKNKVMYPSKKLWKKRLMISIR